MAGSETPQVMISYRVTETGSKELGGDGTVDRLSGALRSAGYTVFVGESSLQVSGEAGWVGPCQCQCRARVEPRARWRDGVARVRSIASSGQSVVSSTRLMWVRAESLKQG